MMMEYRQILFDCDGVLVDSERLTNTVFAEMLGELGLVFTLEDMFGQFVGNSTATCMALIEEKLGRPVPGGFLADYKQRCKIVLERELKPVSGVRNVLERLSVPYGVASSGDHEKIRLTLGITKLLPFFEGRIFSVTDVAHPKPAPDVFLYAARTLGASPAETLVIEDTPIGVRAGVAAGMRVIGYAELMSTQRLTEAGALTCVYSMDQLGQLLRLPGS
ncbi:MAG: HAD family hydrolase [Armatimonas sp.]